MASTSPYQNNDYQSTSTFRPYQLPVNDIVKDITAQNQYWEEGALRVKNVYDNALDLKLSLAPNKEIRDNYLREAQEKLTKLSGMNLADPGVQRQGINLFKPLFDDEGILSDDQATRHIEKVNTDALNYRNTDGGKLYSQTNHKYALEGANEFQNSTDRMAGKAYLQKRKEFEPFYDPTSELDRIMKWCKPDKASNEAPQGYYMKGYSDESLSAAKVNLCLSGGLSQKAQRQIQINASVAYRGNPEALRDEYIPHLSGTRSQLSEEKAAMEGVLANKDNLKNLKKADLEKLGITDISQITPEFLKGLEDNVASRDTRITNINETISKLQKGDFSPIEGDNYETVAGSVYSHSYLRKMASGLAYNWQTSTTKSDPTQMMFYQQNQINARQKDAQQFDAEQQSKLFAQQIKLKKMEQSAAGGSFSNMSPEERAGTFADGRVSSNEFSQIDEGNPYDQTLNKIDGYGKDIDKTKNWYREQLRTFYKMPSYAPESEEEKKWIENFELTSKGNAEREQLIYSKSRKIADAVVNQTILKGLIDETDAATKSIEAEVIKSITDIKPIALQDGTVITAANIKEALTGNSPIKIIKGSPGINFSTGNMVPINSGYTSDRVIINGVEVKDPNLFRLIEQVKGKTIEGRKALQSRRNEVMGEQTVLQNEAYAIPQLNNDKGEFKMKLAQAINLPSKYISKLQIGLTDGRGKVKVSLMDPEKTGETDYDKEGALAGLTRYGAMDNPRVDDMGKKDEKGKFVMLTVPTLAVIDDARMSHRLEGAVRSIEKSVTDLKNKSTHFIPAMNGESIRMDISKGLDGSFVYRIMQKDKDNAIFMSGDRADALRIFEDILSSPKGRTVNIPIK